MHHSDNGVIDLFGFISRNIWRFVGWIPFIGFRKGAIQWFKIWIVVIDLGTLYSVGFRKEDVLYLGLNFAGYISFDLERGVIV